MDRMNNKVAVVTGGSSGIGLALQMVLVNYRVQARSPHSSRLLNKGGEEWIRTYEYDLTIHAILIAGERNEKYGEPYEAKHAA